MEITISIASGNITPASDLATTLSSTEADLVKCARISASCFAKPVAP